MTIEDAIEHFKSHIDVSCYTGYGAIDRKQSMVFDEYGRTWLAYRSKLEERPA